MADIFISYSKLDRAIAESLAQFLEQAGFIVWWDPQLVGGETYRDTIEAQLNDAKAVLVLWSPNSIPSQWVIAEADHASRKHNLVPLRVADLEPGTIPKPFTTLQTTVVDNRPAILQALKRLHVEPRYAPAAGGSLHDKFWKAIDNSDHREDFELYLKEFPEGPQVAFARLKIAQLDRLAKAKLAATPVATATAAAVAPAGREAPLSRGYAGPVLLALAGLGLIGAGAWYGFTEIAQLRQDMARTAAAVDAPRLADEAEWAKAEKVGLIAAWKIYLARRPAGLHADDAEGRIKQRLSDGRQITRLDAYDAVTQLDVDPAGQRVTSYGANFQSISWSLATPTDVRRARAERRPPAGIRVPASVQFGYSSTEPIELLGGKVHPGSGNTYFNNFILSASVGVTIAFSLSPTEACVIVDRRSWLVHTLGLSSDVLEIDEPLKVSAAASFRNAALFAIASDKKVQIFRTGNGARVDSLEGHVAPIRAITANSEGTILATGGDDKTVRIWDVSDLN